MFFIVLVFVFNFDLFKFSAAILENGLLIDTCQNKVSADQYHVTISRAQVYSSSRSRIFLQLSAHQVLGFDWIAGSCQFNSLKTGRIVRKPVTLAQD